MKKVRTILIALLLAAVSGSCAAMIKYYSPLTEVSGRYASLITPDEKGWLKGPPVKNGNGLAKHGANKGDIYTIIATCFKSQIFESENEFLHEEKR